jgi:hypothetical protein
VDDEIHRRLVVEVDLLAQGVAPDSPQRDRNVPRDPKQDLRLVFFGLAFEILLEANDNERGQVGEDTRLADRDDDRESGAIATRDLDGVVEDALLQLG